MKTIVFILAVSLVPAFAQAPAPATNPAGATNQSSGTQYQMSARGEDRINREVRHELAMMPNYTLFDIVNYQLQGNTVVLSGKVRNNVVKGQAEDAVKHVEGVEKVVNNIEVLPPSPGDDAIRMQVARALANRPGLTPYFTQAVPPIHIIVQGGHVELQGVVNSQGDKDAANLVVQGIPGILGTTNDLRVEPSK